MGRRSQLAGLVALVTLGGCGRGSGTPIVDAGSDGGAGPEFVALERDFAPFESWWSFELDGGGQFPRTVFINARPPADATSFPVGTILVKEMVSPTSPTGLEVDAMVKRGGDFNSTGAPGWEFFELALVDGGVPTITWRGTGESAAPTAYGGGGASCVGCHSAAAANDYVQSGPLQLR